MAWLPPLSSERSTLPLAGWGRRTILPKGSGMGGRIKKFLMLDFEGAFGGSFLKLLFFWNPLWILLVVVFWDRAFGSLVFDWGRKFFVATLAVLFGMAVVGAYRTAEGLLARWRAVPRTVHSLGWYLLLLGFALPPGMILASYALIAALNAIFSVGDPIPMDFPLQYYRREILAGWGFLLACFLYVSWQELRDQARLNKLRAEELEKERLQAMLTQLKDQMNPHFLFNTLNTVASLIPQDPSKAEQVVVKLSALYQGVLASTRKTLHPLSKELEFCRDYLDIEKARFGRRLRAIVGRPQGAGGSRALVPVLLLQPLVENAVKHGLTSRAGGGRLWVTAKVRDGGLSLVVEDDGVGFGKSPYSGSGTALENCRKRLELAYGAKGSLRVLPRKGGGTRIEVLMPLLKDEDEVVHQTVRDRR